MKKVLLSFVFIFLCTVGMSAQEYTIKSAGQGKSGNYLVEITVTTKSKEKNINAEDLVKRYAVHGVLFRGFASSEGYGEQKPLIKDPDIEQTKADFFGAFFNDGAYKRYASIVNSSLTSTKLARKYYEVSAVLLVDKESLQHYLEESGIVKGFSNLW